MPDPDGVIQESMKRRRIVRNTMLGGALIGVVLPFLLGPRARILTSAMPRGAAGVVFTAVVFALFGAGYGWVTGELFAHFADGPDDPSST